jgi:capsid protein
MIDPKTEIASIKDAIRSGLKTPQEAIREQGYDPEQFFAEYSEGMKLFDKYELTLDSDARKVAINGGKQPDPQGVTNA